MKKIFYSVFIISLFAVGVAHAEDGMMGGGNQPITGVMNPTWLRVMPVMGTDTPKMIGGDKERRPMMGTGTPPSMGSGTPPMMPPIMIGSSTCRKFSRSLSFGAKGDDVKELQEMLRENGFLDASSTGYFGMMTKAAVVKFQKEGGLNPSGYFGELSRKQHDKRCGEGRGRDGSEGSGGDDKRMGSSTPLMMGSSKFPCETKFDPQTGRPCKPKDDDRKPPMMGTGTPPTGIMCTMEARMCPDGTMMPRDNSCGWHPEKCGVLASTTPSI